MSRITPRLWKIIIILGLLSIFGLKVAKDKGYWGQAEIVASNVPIKTDLPAMPEAAPPADNSNSATPVVMPSATPVASNSSCVKFMIWAWNAQQSLILSNGGKITTEGSLQKKWLNGRCLELVHQEDGNVMRTALINLAKAMKEGKPIPPDAVQFVAVMGDGGGQFLQPLREQLKLIDPSYEPEVIGSAGRSDGEDKLMGPPAWKKNAQNAKGGVVAGVLRDGDWNIALKWIRDNWLDEKSLKNNPDETTWDPDALNWVNSDTYIKAAEAYNSQEGFAKDDPKCGDRKEIINGKLTGNIVHKCVDGVVTWTPGDVNIFKARGGLVSVVSTHQYRSQMPNTIIGLRQWNEKHPEFVTGMLAAMFQASDQHKASSAARHKAAELSAVVYKDQDEAYWFKYMTIQVEKDKTGLDVELGGSQVFNLADNQQLFGMVPGSANLFAATYTTFGDLVVQQYPKIVPTYPPVKEILNTSYIARAAALLSKQEDKPLVAAQPAEVVQFAPDKPIVEEVSKRSWHLEFKIGGNELTVAGLEQFEVMKNDLLIAGSLAIELHGHTDNKGRPDQNMTLSQRRAMKIKQLLMNASLTNFPSSRIKVIAHGQTEPKEPNDTEAGREANRRVEVILGSQE